MYRLGIIVNPMSGRDVRRVAARASTSSHIDKQHQVARLVIAALENGVDEVLLAREPFRINERAVENLPQRDHVTLIDVPPSHSAQDSVDAVNRMWAAGCRTFVVLGGDGTNRAVAGACPDAVVLPLSTGTNNVFPYMVEPSVAGAAAGLVASERIAADDDCLRSKRIHATTRNASEIALVDAALLRGDLLGSLLPFEPGKIATVVLARADPASIGMSPIGGYVLPCGHADDFGVMVRTGKPAAYHVRVPISAGLYGDIDIAETSTLEFGRALDLVGPGILAFDGDRTLELAAGEPCRVTLQRDGPRVIEPALVMRRAVSAGLLSSSS